MRRMTFVVTLGALGALALLPGVGSAQRRPATKPIEIRGQVPTPQVVTVRPREVPAYSRQVLVPAFYNHVFWPALLPGYDLVPRRTVIGGHAVDSIATPTLPVTPGGSATSAAPPAASFTTPADTTRLRPAPDSAARTPGTAPARTPR